MGTWSIRRYAGTLADAQGILDVERKTFRECPYTAEELRARLGAPEQKAWVAEAGGHVAGFVAGFRTSTLRGTCIEADLLAVDPSRQGRGIATGLLVALRRDAREGQVVRGVVNVHNPASDGAFRRAGFSPSPDTYDLLVYRIRGRAPRSPAAWGGTIRPVRSLQEAGLLAGLASSTLQSAESIQAAFQAPQTMLLAAWLDGTMAAGIELLEVHTLLYSGLWLEALSVGRGGQRTQAPLVAAAVEVAKERGLDEVGCLVASVQWPLRALLLAEGFLPLDSYRIWRATPLPDEAGRP